MIKSFYNITLKDVILLDATKSAKHLKKYWFIPLWFCRSQLEKLAGQIFEAIGNKAIDTIQDDFDRLLSYRGLQILEALHKLLIIELKLKSKINVWKLIAGKDYSESKQLEEVLAEVLKHTGIEIKTPEDISEFTKYLEYRIDKHKELFPEVDPDELKEAVKLSRVIYSVFNFMAEPYNENMRLITFIELKEMAEERISKTNNQDDGSE